MTEVKEIRMDFYLVVSDFWVRIVLGAEDLKAFTIGLFFAVVIIAKHSMVFDLGLVLGGEGCLRFNLEAQRTNSIITTSKNE